MHLIFSIKKKKRQTFSTHLTKWADDKQVTVFLFFNEANPDISFNLSSKEETFVLRFYGPVNPMGSCRVQSVYLTTLLLGRLSPLRVKPVLCIFFHQKLQLTFLNQLKGENDLRKYFMIKSPRKNVANPAGVERATSWSPVGRASNWTTEADTFKWKVKVTY